MAANSLGSRTGCDYASGRFPNSRSVQAKTDENRTIPEIISAGGSYTCGVKSDGTLTCWGWNKVNSRRLRNLHPGQRRRYSRLRGEERRHARVLGWNEYGQASPPAGAFTQVSAGAQVTGGYSHTCGVKSDGTLACWGWNGHGQTNAPAGIFTQVSAGLYHTCGLKSDSTLACWGWNEYGQASPPAGAFIQVNAGNVHTCGLRSDGTLACWGANFVGESTPPAGAFTQVSAGYDHSCGVKTDGTLACWGGEPLWSSRATSKGGDLHPGQRRL